LSKEKTPMDSADTLAQRQGELLETILQGIQQGGLTDETWLRIYAERIQLADRGFITPRTQTILHFFNDHQLYRKPRRLSQLVKHLITEFNTVQRLYTNKGWVHLTTQTETQYESTMSGESPSLDTLPDWNPPTGEQPK